MTKAKNDIWRALEDTDVAMLVDNFGPGLRARPMGIFARPGEHAIYLVSDRDTSKVDEVKAHPEVCLTAEAGARNRYLSVSGFASVLEDRAKLAALWNAWLDAWFDGPDDPKAVLIKVEPAQGEIWDGDVTPVASVKMLAAAATGDTADVGSRARAAM